MYRWYTNGTQKVHKFFFDFLSIIPTFLYKRLCPKNKALSEIDFCNMCRFVPIIFCPFQLSLYSGYQVILARLCIFCCPQRKMFQDKQNCPFRLRSDLHIRFLNACYSDKVLFLLFGLKSFLYSPQAFSNFLKSHEILTRNLFFPLTTSKYVICA